MEREREREREREYRSMRILPSAFANSTASIMFLIVLLRTNTTAGDRDYVTL
jgi:hypothetical protein